MKPTQFRLVVGCLLAMASIAAACRAAELADEGEWKRHTIDNTSRGADGVRVADVNGDGLPDLTTGWEEGGQVRVYLHPGANSSQKPWPAVTVGQVKSPEDAVFADLNGDGAADVVSSCEGRERTVFVHWAPKRAEDYLNASKWRTEAIPATVKKQAWMFATPLRIDDSGPTDLIVGSKGPNASVGIILIGKMPEDVASYRFVKLTDAGWIMSLLLYDLDADGDSDIVYSDRKGKHRAVWWLENPGRGAADAKAWRKHLVGGKGMEVMFLDVADLDQDGKVELITATRDRVLLVHRRGDSLADPWRESRIPNPLMTPNGKAVRAADIDGDGKVDLVHSCNNGGKREFHGVVWMRSRGADAWETRTISGPAGVKFDLLQLLDIDRDGDLDVVTCEERDNLGVFWYENPSR